MLDQNTDRMWFVIGAVLIGAGLIAAANLLFPSLFKTMADTFTSMLNNAKSGLDGINFNPDGTSGTGRPPGVINIISGLRGLPLF